MDGRGEERRGETRQQWVARTADWQLGPTAGTGPFQRPTTGRGSTGSMHNEDRERERGRTVEGRKKMQSVILLHAHLS